MTEAEESSSVCCSAIVVRALFNTVSTFKRAFLSCLRAPHSNFSALTVLLAVRANLDCSNKISWSNYRRKEKRTDITTERQQVVIRKCAMRTGIVLQIKCMHY